MERIAYSDLKTICQREFSVSFPWEYQVPDEATHDDRLLLALLWNAFLREVPSSPPIPNQLWR